jgi:hypothetical protein
MHASLRSARVLGALTLTLTSTLAGCGSGPGGVDASVRDEAGPSPTLDGAVDEAGVAADGAVSVDAGELLAPLPGLPATASTATDHFTSHDRCAMCHRADDGDALRDASGRDVSPVSLWRSSMMAFSARDPVYLAAFAHELEAIPAAEATIEATCTRCHAPAGSEEHRRLGTHVTFEALTAGPDPLDRIGREGVTCTVCHQISAEGLGSAASFTGGYRIVDDRRIFGPHASPLTRPMERSVGFTPTLGDHLLDGEHCATCHTVITHALDDAGAVVGPAFPEQVPYLEWRNSAFASGPEAATCQDCHAPTVDEDGVPLVARIATRPPFLDARSPLGRHTFRGANAYVLDLIADNVDWVGIDVPAETIRTAADDSEASLRRAARLTVPVVERDGDVLRIVAEVENLTGHRFPTGFPTRRAWLRVSGLDAGGAVVWQSGGVDDAGGLVDAEGRRLDRPDDTLPHRQTVVDQGAVQVWHAEMLDVVGERTHVLLRAARFGVDNRLLPRGWSEDHPDAAMTGAVGVEGDPDFVAGADRTEYRIPLASGAVRVRVELLFQSVTPTMVEALAAHPTGAWVRLTQMMTARPATPISMASLEVAP